MFSMFHTRIILLLVLIITFMICVIGLNIKSGKKEKFIMKANLEVPQIESTYVKKPKKNKDNSEFSGVLKDEGKTIVLD